MCTKMVEDALYVNSIDENDSNDDLLKLADTDDPFVK